jgi:biopolymer transport protein ExbD
MKIQGAKKIHYDSGPNMTPLVDVVMVILIFLMLAGSFGGATTFLLSKQGIKAKGGAHRPLKLGEVPDTPIDIYVDNLRDVDGFVANVTGMEPMTKAEEIRAVLESKREQFLRTGTPADQLQVVLHPRINTKYRYLIAVYQAAVQAKFEKIAFATSQ